MSTPDIISALIKDHRTVTKLFSQLEKTTARSARRRAELFRELDESLSFHAEFEEAHVYPLLEGRKKSKPLALEALEEHVQVKRLLAEMRDLTPTDEHWEAKLTVLTENVRHHVEEEEGETFPQLKQAVDEEQLQRLGEEYLAAKEDKPAPMHVEV